MVRQVGLNNHQRKLHACQSDMRLQSYKLHKRDIGIGQAAQTQILPLNLQRESLFVIKLSRDARFEMHEASREYKLYSECSQIYMATVLQKPCLPHLHQPAIRASQPHISIKSTLNAYNYRIVDSFPRSEGTDESHARPGT